MLLCAGLGTRLGALSDERPKPMLPVCDIPIVRYGIANLVAHGITDVVINLHHRGGVIERELGDGRAFGARIQYSHEPTILGTGGGLKHALRLLAPSGDDEPFLSCNGKLIFDVDLAAVIAAYHEAVRTHSALGLMVVQRSAEAQSWGAVAVEAGRVRNILGAGDHMFCGVHVTRPSVIARLPDGEACMVRQGYLPWIQAGGYVAAYLHEHGYFAEHSTPERYLDSNWALIGGQTLRHPPGVLRGIDPSAQVHPSATIHQPVRIGQDAVIGARAVVGPNVVVGRGAVIEAGCQLENTVVWPAARCDRSLTNAIVAEHGVVELGTP